MNHIPMTDDLDGRSKQLSMAQGQAARAFRTLFVVVAIAHVLAGTLAYFADDDSQPLPGAQASSASSGDSEVFPPEELPCMTADSRARYAMVSRACSRRK